MAGRFVLPLQAVYDGNGDPLAGAKGYFYESGTSTPLDTFSDDALTIANTNPVIADANGRFPDIFLKGQDYKFTLDTSADVTVFTADPVRGDDGSAVETASPTTTYTAPSDGADRDIFADATAGAFTVTLPPLADAGSGTVRVIKEDDSANAVTVDPDGSEAINGFSEILLRNKGDALIIKPHLTQWYAFSLPQTQDFSPLPRGYLYGLTLSINGTDSEHDLDIAVGAARDSDNSVNMLLDTALTKRIDAAWAVGTGNGGLDTGSVAADSVYHVWLIKRTDTGVIDVLFSLSATTPTMPANYSKKLRIGSVGTETNANLSGQLAQVLAGGSEIFESAPLEITAAAAVNLTHGMSKEPNQVENWLQCESDAFGYVAGEKVPTAHFQEGPGSTATDKGASLIPTATEIKVKYGNEASTFSVIRIDTGNRGGITNTFWRHIVRARAN